MKHYFQDQQVASSFASALVLAAIMQRRGLTTDITKQTGTNRYTGRVWSKWIIKGELVIE